MADHVDLVLAPSSKPDEPFSLFIEIEVGGKSVRVGQWLKRSDGLFALRITKDEIENLETP